MFHPADHVQQDIHPTDNPPQSARKNRQGEARCRGGRWRGLPPRTGHHWLICMWRRPAPAPAPYRRTPTSHQVGVLWVTSSGRQVWAPISAGHPQECEQWATPRQGEGGKWGMEFFTFDPKSQKWDKNFQNSSNWDILKVQKPQMRQSFIHVFSNEACYYSKSYKCDMLLFDCHYIGLLLFKCFKWDMLLFKCFKWGMTLFKNV